MKGVVTRLAGSAFVTTLAALGVLALPSPGAAQLRAPQTAAEQAEVAKKLNDPKWLAEQARKLQEQRDNQVAADRAAYDKLRAGRFKYNPIYGCRTVFNADGSVTNYDEHNRVFDPATNLAADRSCRNELPPPPANYRPVNSPAPDAQTPAVQKVAVAPVAARPTAATNNAPAKPSFDCAKAASPVEKMICADPELASRDQRVTAAYRSWIAQIKAGTMIDSMDEVVSDQRAWMAERNKCQTSACVRQSYDSRLEDLPGGF